MDWQSHLFLLRYLILRFLTEKKAMLSKRTYSGLIGLSGRTVNGLFPQMPSTGAL